MSDAVKFDDGAKVYIEFAHGIAQGNAKLAVGAYVDLEGLGPLFSGKYYLASVKHTFSGTAGFLTEFTGERSGIGKAA